MSRWFVALLLGALAGCAHPVVQPCPPGGCTDQEGIRFYRPVVLVSVAADGTTKPFPLPDTSREYYMHVSGWLGDANLNPTLSDGWNLTALSSNTNNDSTVAALAGAAGAAKGLMSGALFPRATGLAPGLYRFDSVNMRLIGPLSTEIVR